MSTSYRCAHCGRTPGHVGVSFDDGWFQRHFRDCPGLTSAWLLAEARDWADYQRRLLSDAQWAMHGDEFPDTFPWEAQP